MGAYASSDANVHTMIASTSGEQVVASPPVSHDTAELKPPQLERLASATFGEDSEVMLDVDGASKVFTIVKRVNRGDGHNDYWLKQHGAHNLPKHCSKQNGGDGRDDYWLKADVLATSDQLRRHTGRRLAARRPIYKLHDDILAASI